MLYDINTQNNVLQMRVEQSQRNNHDFMYLLNLVSFTPEKKGKYNALLSVIFPINGKSNL